MAHPDPLVPIPGVATHLERIEAALQRSVTAQDELMADMAGHLIAAGGKRLRPLFCVAAAGAAAPDPPAFAAAVTDEAILGGVSVELVHLGSLYHDDVIDEAATRRTVESVNARWGNLKAILAGDFLLAKASEFAATLGTEVAQLLAATISRLCEGEVRELRRAYDVARTEEDYLTAIGGKTAALFSTACRIGALIGGLPRHQVDTLTSFGSSYGMAFQIVDDVLDVVGTDEQLGKPAGLDLAEGVYTLPAIRALAAPGSDELAALLGAPLDQGESAARARLLVQRSGGVAEAIEVARGYADRALHQLTELGGGPAVHALAAATRRLLSGVEAAAA